LAVANSLAAVQAGARMVQGTINGYGERTGNARHFVVSEMAGRASLRQRVGEMGLGVPSEDFLRVLTQAVEEGKSRGMRYEQRPAAFERLVLALIPGDASAWRPAHAASAEQVHMKVGNGGVGIAAG